VVDQSEVILCEAIGPHGMKCTLQYGHQPEDRHAWSVMLPPELGPIVAQVLNDYERHAREAKVYARRVKIAFYVCCFVVGFNLTAVIMRLFGA